MNQWVEIATRIFSIQEDMDPRKAMVREGMIFLPALLANDKHPLCINGMFPDEEHLEHRASPNAIFEAFRAISSWNRPPSGLIFLEELEDDFLREIAGLQDEDAEDQPEPSRLREVDPPQIPPEAGPSHTTQERSLVTLDQIPQVQSTGWRLWRVEHGAREAELLKKGKAPYQPPSIQEMARQEQENQLMKDQGKKVPKGDPWVR